MTWPEIQFALVWRAGGLRESARARRITVTVRVTKYPKRAHAPVAEALVFPMLLSQRSKLGCLVLSLPLVLAVVGLLLAEVIKDGGFPSVEYRLRFVDQNGRPVQGISLEVRTRAGGTSYFYPVNEFVPDQPVVSDRDGRMEFHHVSEGLEFSIREYGDGIWPRFGQARAPQYDSIFTLNGREVFRTRFDSLYKGDQGRLPTVRRHRPNRDWPRQLFKTHANDWDDGKPRFFDLNQDGELDREEMAAAFYCGRQCDDERPNDELEFEVIEKTIIISNP